MSFLHRLQSARKKLTKVETVITRPDGSVEVEKRAAGGGFRQASIQIDDDKLGVIKEDKEAVPGASGDEVSKRRQKKVARARQFGYVVDLKPDLQVAHVAECVYMSSQDVAADFVILSKHKITHIINCATGIKNMFPKNFKYLNLELLDEPTTSIKPHFKTTNEFILNAISNKGRVLIHCNAGVSRSATLAIAYIMWSQRKSFHDANEHVKKVRPSSRPNDGFVRQLHEYEDELFRSAVCRTS